MADCTGFYPAFGSSPKFVRKICYFACLSQATSG
jgi:hypothetical protein